MYLVTKVLLLMFVVLLLGCYQQIIYETDSIMPMSQRDIAKSISIEIPLDKRADESALKRPLFLYKKNTNSVCYNLENEYGSNYPPKEIAKLMAYHLKLLIPNTKIFVDMKDSADYSLEFVLSDFSCVAQMQDRGQDKIGSTIVGAVALSLDAGLSGNVSRFEYHIVYKSVNVCDKKGNLLFSIPSFVSEEIIEIPEITFCTEMYMRMNNELKKHNQKLLTAVCDSLNARLQ